MNNPPSARSPRSPRSPGSSAFPRIGELLLRAGAVSAEQLQYLLEIQPSIGRPLGELAETLLDTDPKAVEAAWAQQYLSYLTRVDLDHQTVHATALAALDRRQAWQFDILPLRREGGFLLLATREDNLKRAVEFAWRQLDEPVRIVVADDAQLEAALMKHYPWPAMRPHLRHPPHLPPVIATRPVGDSAKANHAVELADPRPAVTTGGQSC